MRSVIANDMQNINPKFKDREEHGFFCKHIMTVNNLQKLNINQGNMRRQVLIKISKVTSNKNRRVSFKLEFEKNMNALIAFMLQGLFKLHANGFKELEGHEEVRNQFIYENEPEIIEFSEQCLNITENLDDLETKADIYQAYLGWHQKYGEGLKKHNKIDFGRKLSSILEVQEYEFETKKSATINGKYTRVTKGIKLNEEGKKCLKNI